MQVVSRGKQAPDVRRFGSQRALEFGLLECMHWIEQNWAGMATMLKLLLLCIFSTTLMSSLSSVACQVLGKKIDLKQI
jgi:hypothetical protein